jgi:uncharacterized RDD family membrane protein YckC
MTDPAAPATPVPADPNRRGAGVGMRAAATVIDSVLLLALLVAWFVWFAHDGRCDGGFSLNYNVGSTYHSVCGAPAALFYLIVLAYFIVLEKLYGWTPGKLLFGLRVVRADGDGGISWGAAIGRTLLRVIDGILFYLVAAIAVWSSDRNQRLGDMAAKTLVVPAQQA